MPKPILLDANLSILIVVGLTNVSYISKHKRLSAYDEVDFKIVSNLIAASSGVIFTPNVLTETSNMVRYVGDPVRTEISKRLADVVARSQEIYVDSAQAVRRSEYIRLGITDAVLLTLAEQGGVLLTDDFDLYRAAVGSGLTAVNYSHVRMEQRPDYQRIFS